MFSFGDVVIDPDFVQSGSSGSEGPSNSEVRNGCSRCRNRENEPFLKGPQYPAFLPALRADDRSGNDNPC